MGRNGSSAERFAVRTDKRTGTAFAFLLQIYKSFKRNKGFRRKMCGIVRQERGERFAARKQTDCSAQGKVLNPCWDYVATRRVYIAPRRDYINSTSVWKYVSREKGEGLNRAEC